MKRRSTHALLAALLLTCARHAAAQETPARPDAAAEAARAEGERRAELEKKSVALLREAVSEAQGLRLVENRVRPQVAAAGLLWARDEQGARALLKAAADALAAYASSLDPEDPQFYNDAQSVWQMRAEFVQAVAQYDPKLALEYMRATRPPHAEALRTSGFPQEEQERQLEMTLAARVASQDPARALRMAEQSLSKGLTASLISVLQELSAKDPAAASKLSAQIVKRLRAEELANNYDLSGLAFQLLSIAPSDAPPPPPDVAPNLIIDGPSAVTVARRFDGGAGAVMDGQTRAELVEKIVTAALIDMPNQPGAYNLYNALRALLPEFEKTAPARAEALRRRTDALEHTFNPQADAWLPYRQLTETGTTDALLEAAPKAPPEVREQLYTQAAWKAFNEGDAERARQIIENISNPQQRGQLRRAFEMQTLARAAQEGDYAAARAAMSRLATPEEKIATLMQIAASALSKGDARTARQALDEARTLTAAQSSGPQQFQAQLQVATAYAQLEPRQSFEMVESMIARLNELLDAAAALEGFGQDSFREGELRPQYGYVWNDLISQCAGVLAALAPGDFERASADAKSFRRAEVRAAAELHLAQSVLGSMPQVQSNQKGEGEVPLRVTRRGGIE